MNNPVKLRLIKGFKDSKEDLFPMISWMAHELISRAVFYKKQESADKISNLFFEFRRNKDQNWILFELGKYEILMFFPPPPERVYLDVEVTYGLDLKKSCYYEKVR